MTGIVRRAGFTLMELIVAIAITGAVAAIGAGTLATVIDQRGVLERGTEGTERAAALRGTLEDWLTQGTVRVQIGGAPGRGRGVGSGTMSAGPGSESGVSDEVSISTRALTPSGSPTTLVRLFIDDDPDTPASGLSIQYQGRAQDSLVTRQLEPSVGAMRVEYLDRRTHRWYPASEAATIQPMAIRITLGGAGGDSLPPVLRLPIVEPVGIDPAEPRQ